MREIQHKKGTRGQRVPSASVAGESTDGRVVGAEEGSLSVNVATSSSACGRDWMASSVVADITPQVHTVSNEVHSVAIQIAPNAVDLALLLATARIPRFGRAEVSVDEGSQLTLQSIVPLRSLFAQRCYIVANISAVASNVADVPTDLVRRGSGGTGEQQGCRGRPDQCDVFHDETPWAG